MRKNNLPILKEILAHTKVIEIGGMPANQVIDILEQKGLTRKEATILIRNAQNNGKVERESRKWDAIVRWVEEEPATSGFTADQFADILQLKPTRPDERVIITLTITSRGSEISMKHYNGRGC